MKNFKSSIKESDVALSPTFGSTQYVKGDDGFSPIVETSKTDNVTTISITDAVGTKQAIINDGEKGNPGSDGYSPVRGTDYWTEADKIEIVNEVLSNLPGLIDNQTLVVGNDGKLKTAIGGDAYYEFSASWDGDLTGKTTVGWGDTVGYVLVSDEVLTKEQILNSSVNYFYTNDYGTLVSDTHTCTEDDLYEETSGLFSGWGWGIVVYSACTANDLNFEKPGVYFYYEGEKDENDETKVIPFYFFTHIFKVGGNKLDANFIDFSALDASGTVY